MVTARASGERVEDLSQRSETGYVFANPDGSWTAESAADPFQVEDERGVWHPLDMGLVERDGGLAPRYGSADVVFSAGGDKTFARVSEAGKDLAWEWPTVLPAPVVEGDTATYRDAVAGGDLVVTAHPTGFSHSVVLHQRPTGPVVFSVPVELDGAAITENARGSLTVTDDRGRRLVEAPEPLMWDSSTDAEGQPRVRPVDTTVETTPAGRSRVVLSPDAGFLADPATVYPVTVDPSYVSHSTGDTWVQNRDYTSSQVTSTELRAGTYDGGTTKARSYVRFDDDPWVGANVTSATLRLRNFYSGSCTGSAIRINRIIESWRLVDATMSFPDVGVANTADYVPAHGYNSNCGADNANFDVTGIVGSWAGGTPNYGLRIKAVDETSNFTWRKYRSADYDSAPAFQPKLIVTYNRYPGKASAPVLSPMSTYAAPGSSTASTYTSSLRPKFTAKATDPDGGKVQIRFEVHDSTTSTTPIRLCMTGEVSSGANASCAITTALPDGGTYFVRAKAFDGTNWAGKSRDAAEGWSSWTTFKVANAAPPAPSIDCAPYADGSWTDTPPTQDVTCTVTLTGSGTTAPGYVSWWVNDPNAAVRKHIAQPTATATRTVSVTVPKAPGGYRVTAVAESPAGVESATDYGFGYGKFSLSTPTTSVPGEPSATTAGTVAIKADGPVNTTTSPAARLRWRVASSGGDAATGWNTVTSPGLTVTSDGVKPVTVSGVWNTAGLTRDAAQGIDLDPRTPVLLEVQVCLDYPGGEACTWSTTPSTVLRVPSAFGAGFPVTDAGPGQVALFTGELATGGTDAVVPGGSGALSVSRTWTSFTGPHDPAVPAAGVFGPGWTAQLDGPDAGLAGMLAADSTLIDGTIALVDADGSALVYSLPGGPKRRTGGELTVNGAAVALVPVDEDTALAEVHAQVSGTGAGTQLKVTDVDGTVTTFAVTRAPGTGVAAVFAPASVQEPGQTTNTTYSHDGQGRVTRIVAPAPAGVTCPATGALGFGCRALVISYATTTTAVPGTPGDVAGQITQIAYEAYHPDKAVPGMDQTVLAKYAYDSTGRLVQVTDTQTGLVTGYGYDSNGRLVTYDPPGVKTVRLTYDAQGRLSTVTRDNPTGTGSTRLQTIIYGVPIDGTGGTPTLTQATVARWQQRQAPTAGYAVFGPDRPTVAPTADQVTATDWPYASLFYTDARGYTLNTAGYGAGQWLFTATDYDPDGNVVRDLSTGDIAGVLNDALDPADVGTLYRYDPVVRTNTDGTTTETIPAGALVSDVYAPARMVTLTTGERVWARPHTKTSYDQGAPNGGINPATDAGYGLPTTTLTSVWDVATETDLTDSASTTKTGYAPIEPGDTTGWSLGMPTTSTVVVPGGADITSRTRYHDDGRVLETRQPASTGTDAGTRQIVYYTAGTAAGAPTECQSTPQWAGEVCQIRYAAAPSSGPALPVTQTTGYDRYLQPTTVTETVAGTLQRTTHTRYDTAGRVTKTWTTAVASSPSAPGTGYTYDPATGAATTQTALDDTGQPTTGTVTTGYDTWGRPTSYTPAAGETTTTGYDTAGRVATVTDPVGTTSYSYDGADTGDLDAHGLVERRGLPTRVTVTNPGGRAIEFTGAYDAAGALVTQTLPGGITQRTETDTAGQPVGLTYTGQVTNPDTGAIDPNGDWLGWSQTRDLHGRVTHEWTPSGAGYEAGLTGGAAAAGYSRAYTYDPAGRLTRVVDHTTPAGGGTPTVDGDGTLTTPTGTVCQTRAYGFDANGNRTSLTRTGAASTGECATTGGQTTSWAYDTADRITGGYTYDTLGRATTIPAHDTPAGTPAGNLTLGYYNTDAIASITQNGSTTSYSLDPVGRRSVATTAPTGGGTATQTVAHHYTNPGDNPTWVDTTTNGTTTRTRYASSLAGDLALTITTPTGGGTPTVTLPLADPHGDTPTSITLPTTGPATTLTDWTDTDEYGNPLTTNPGTTTTSTTGIGYGWLGAKQRATTTTGLLLMGARVYNPVTGAFTSTDPVYGGNTTAYTYPQDPVNKFDLTGLWEWTRFVGSRFLSRKKTRRLIHILRGAESSAGAQEAAGYLIGLFPPLEGAGQIVELAGRLQRHWVQEFADQLAAVIKRKRHNRGVHLTFGVQRSTRGYGPVRAYRIRYVVEPWKWKC